MAGTVEGGKQAAETNKKRFGGDFYSKIGNIGGSVTNTKTPKGFAADRERARTAGALGGRKSRRGPISIYRDPIRQAMETMEVGDSITVTAGEEYDNAVRAQRIMKRSAKAKRFVIHVDAMDDTIYRTARTR